MMMLAKLLLVLVFTTGVSQAIASEQDIRNQIALGALAFADNCQKCHQLDGYGEDKLYPSLHNATLLGDKSLLIQTILHGRLRDQEETGKTATLMPSLRFLTNQEVAAIIAFITNSWGKDIMIVTEQEVDDAR